MNSVLCVSNFSNRSRLFNFMSSLGNTIDIDKIKVVVVNTAQDIDDIRTIVSSIPICHLCQLGINRPVSPTEQVSMRIDAVSQYCTDDTIYHNFDDDYVFNPHWHMLTMKVFSECGNVNIISLLKQIPGIKYVVSNHIVEDNIKLCGFNFARVRSSMGGGFSIRWSVFKDLMRDFLHEYDTNNQFDTDIWHIAGKRLGEGPIYMLQDFSLYQHTNQVSQYGHHWPHSYGADYDPIVNPFDILIGD